MACQALTFDPVADEWLQAHDDEALEIAKKFGTLESSRFINGVLDRVLREHRPTSA